MAFRLTGYYWKSMVNRLRGCATYGTSTSPKMKAYASATGYGHTLVEEQSKSKVKVKGDFVPVYVALGMILLQASLALHIAKQHLMYSPSVRVKKKLRETMPEVDYPDKVVDDAYKFTGNSFFRKAAHIQEFESGFQWIPDPISKDVYAHTPQAVTLKSVGIDPSTQHSALNPATLSAFTKLVYVEKFNLSSHFHFKHFCTSPLNK